ncbi:MAG: hypothetical protein E5X35_07380 [Mesorhizobium sp.]|uniref:hypothetical protein n=1 Tax=Mesorhizobium sp. TaxID=1871066 RepID=UPI0012079B73|nr:hypothetical protein [Mesorhizobium sp.]TIR34530.1 MAG: hypothetical protein E5X35_07380 [Mesorhizobium sp.]
MNGSRRSDGSIAFPTPPEPSEGRTIVTIYALSMPPYAMFRREFERPVDADDYIAFWRRLGSCHVRWSAKK